MCSFEDLLQKYKKERQKAVGRKKKKNYSKARQRQKATVSRANSARMEGKALFISPRGLCLAEVPQTPLSVQQPFLSTSIPGIQQI